MTTLQPPPLPKPGGHLGLLNNGWTLHQWPADWVCLRPDLATALQWKPDPDVPGRWLTQNGEATVERVWWVDGWWGRSQQAFDDTEAEGHAVLVSPAGVNALLDALGPLTTTIAVTRRKPEGPEKKARANQPVARRG